MRSFLDREHSGQTQTSRPPRTARVQVTVRKNSGPSKLIELLANLDTGSVIKKVHLAGKHPYIDSAYMQAAETACRADPRVQAEIEKLSLPEGASVVIEPWAYATDGMKDMSERTTMVGLAYPLRLLGAATDMISQCWFYMRLLDHPDANFYAYPLDLCAEVSEQLKVINVYHLPSSETELIPDEARPYDHGKVHATERSEYHPDLRPPPRTTTKPYQVIQPEGPSFTVDGNRLSWEKWTMWVGFNYREGLTIHDIRYAGRSLFTGCHYQSRCLCLMPIPASHTLAKGPLIWATTAPVSTPTIYVLGATVSG